VTGTQASSVYSFRTQDLPGAERVPRGPAGVGGRPGLGVSVTREAMPIARQPAAAVSGRFHHHAERTSRITPCV